MAGWIKMPLGTDAGLDPTNIMLDGYPSLPPQNGTEPPPQFSADVLWPNGWMNQNATSYVQVDLSSGLIVLDGDANILLTG